MHVRSGGPLLAATSGGWKCYNPSVFALRLTHLGTLVTGKFTRIWGFHSSPTTSVIFDSNLAEPLISATWNEPVPTKGCLKSPTGNRGALMLSRPAEAVHTKTANSEQRVVSNYSANLTQVFRTFPQFQDKCQGIIKKGHGPPSPIMEAFSWSYPPPSQVAEAISQSNPNNTGFKPQRAIKPNSFLQGHVAWWDNLPPVVTTPSLKTSRRSAPTKIPLA
jgi:hypothetical protein